MNDKSTSKSLFKHDSSQKDSKKYNTKQKNKTQAYSLSGIKINDNGDYEVIHNRSNNYEEMSSDFNQEDFSNKEADFCGSPISTTTQFFDDLNYIDDIMEDNDAFNQSEEIFNLQSVTTHQISSFVVSDKKVVAQLNESKFQAELIDAIDNPSLINNLIFSTSFMNSSKWKEGNVQLSMCGVDNSEVWPLDDFTDQNLVHFDLSFSEKRHSTPVKNRSKLHTISEKFTAIFSSFDEDDDIEENYLETVWNSGPLHSFPVCDLIIRDQKEDEKPCFSHSIICSAEEIEEFSIETSTDMILDKPCEASMQILNHSECQDKILNHIDEGNLSTSSLVFTPRTKDSYKDKLMEGLPKKNPALKTSLIKSVKGSPHKDVKARNEVSPAFGTNDDRRDYITAKTITSDSSVDVADYLEVKSSAADSLWSSQKSRKKGGKHYFRSNGQSLFEAPLTNSLKSEKHNIVLMPLDKENYHSVNSDQHDKKTIDVVKTKQNDKKPRMTSRQFACFSCDEPLENAPECHPTSNSRSIREVAEFSSRAVNRRLKKFKKFCSLDRLSGFQEDSSESLKKHCCKWRSRDDLDLLDPASTLKVDNFFWWPLIGIVVFAGFVAFCFREKISFMIASKFPFERPPI